MYIFVGSTNPVKIQAVKTAVENQWPDAVVEGFEVDSQVAHQPISDEETQTGAVNRAKAALEQGLKKYPNKLYESLGIGLEGGVTTWQQQLWSTVWVAVTDDQGNLFTSNGARMKLPKVIAEPIRSGAEMGPLVVELIGEEDIRRKQGMLGVVTKNFVTRAEEYGSIAKLAIGLWYGRDWTARLK